jgi:plasmid stabilization system protein ParE
VDFQVRITEAALADFEEILAYSWANFPVTAQRFGNAILDHIDLLKSFPYIGSPVPGRPGVRELVHTPILIYYRVNEAPKFVEILHFRHSSRQAERSR